MSHAQAQTNLVSVVIPAFNATGTLADTLQSALDQQGVEVEIIVVDDGSEDHTAELARDRGPRVRVIRQANAGVGAARNRGLAEAQGRWVAFLDSDDLWEPDKLRRQIDLLRQDPSYELCYTGLRLIDASGAPLDDAHTWAETGPRPEGWVYRTLLYEGNTICNSSVLVSRSLIRRAGRFATDPTESEDYDMWLRLARLTKFRYITAPLTIYRVLQVSYYRSDPAVARLRTLKTVNRAADRSGVTRAAQRVALRRRRADILFSIAYELIEQNRDREARPWLLRALREHPLATPALLHLLSAGLPPGIRTRLQWLRRAKL